MHCDELQIINNEIKEEKDDYYLSIEEVLEGFEVIRSYPYCDDE